jgi:hypothetical protein
MGGRLSRRGWCMASALPCLGVDGFCRLAHALPMHPLPVASAAWVIRVRGPARHVAVTIAEILQTACWLAIISMGAQAAAIGNAPNPRDSYSMVRRNRPPHPGRVPTFLGPGTARHGVSIGPHLCFSDGFRQDDKV